MHGTMLTFLVGELFCERILSSIPRNTSGADTSMGSQSQTSIVASISSQVSPFLSNQKAYSELEGNFKLLTRGIVSVAVGLSHNKEVKDFFVHLVEKVGVVPIIKPFFTYRGLSAPRNTFYRDIKLFATYPFYFKFYRLLSHFVL